MKKEIKIEGMSCNHCVMRVKNALDGLDDVVSAQVEIGTATIEVDKDIPDNIIKDAIDDAGYDVVDIK